VLAGALRRKNLRRVYSDLPPRIGILPISRAARAHHLTLRRGHASRKQETIMRFINIATLILVIVGAVNWGLMGLFQLDLVATLFGGPQAALSRIVYVLVGLAGVYQLVPLAGAMSGSADNPQLAMGGRR
jgi:uncharacterized membrane protein YuzA (DUF378 family)